VSVSPTLSEIDLKRLFPFSLDDFQKQAIAALDAGRSVVVCAPTGSGKTLIGEYAIHRALHRNGRVFYTTPLKALSNQKYRDFREQFGDENVGLLTGDLSIERDAPILVMTTEIFRNMLYGTSIGAVGTSLNGVEAVVLDECHYMNDRQRGTVWEESIVYCPPEIQLVALSATVANSELLTRWISHVHGPTELIYSDFRPVPLQFHFISSKGMFPLLKAPRGGKKATEINPRIKSFGKGRQGRKEEPALSFVLSALEQRQMLPAIYFIFSRRGCDRSVEAVGNLCLVTPEEARELRSRVGEFLARNPEAERAGQLEPLLRGIAAHHAGILPAWKGLVEELFQAGLIKVVFATETLAAGINMPARTAVISSLSKRTDDGHRLLKASEFLQMSGRAGRRGMDERGHVVTVQTRFEGAKEAAFLATAQADPLVSQFTPSYGMVLNLLQTHSLEETKELVESSFGQFIANLHLQPLMEEVSQLKEEYRQLASQVAQVNEEDIHSYEKLRARLREEKRLLKILWNQAIETSAQTAREALPTIAPGAILSLKGPNVRTKDPVMAVLVATAPSPGQAPYLICLGEDNRWYVVLSTDAIAINGEFPDWQEVGQTVLPGEIAFKPGQSRKGTAETAEIARQISAIAEPLYFAEVEAQQQRMKAVEAQLEQHPLNQWGSPGALFKSLKRQKKLASEIRKLEKQLDRQLGDRWGEFLNLIDILVEVGCLKVSDAEPDAEDDNPVFEVTAMGESAAAIRGDNELWLGSAVRSGLLDNIDPHHLATVGAALVTEVSRPDTWTNYGLSPAVEAVLGQLQGLRRQLFQLQRRHHIAFPIWLEREPIALVEQWALGVEWNELFENTSLDEGDIVRILRRTLDFLSQIPHVPHISESLRVNAYRAMALIDRFPVNESIE